MFIRALIVLLLVLNLGVAAWWQWSTPAPTAPVVDMPSNVARLQLVREREAGTGAPVSARPAAARDGGATMAPSTADAVASTAPASGPPDEGVSRCYSLGPFTGEEALVAAQATLKPLAEAVAVRRLPPRGGRGWRVHLPALPNAEEAEAVAGRIASAGFRDYFIVRDGPEANSVALGRFASESAARRHADALNAAGFAARAEPMGGATGTAWLDVRVAAGFDVAAARVQAGAAEQRPLDCAALR